jgi:D-alanyl-lipoteichoic acid acyltransferase DltB (MBOAT superfamily)
MVFSSVEFAIFLPIVLALYYCLSLRAQNILLLLASYVFYGWWDWRFLSLLWISTGVDFLIGRELGRVNDDARRKRIIAVSIVLNLTFLGFFKYFGFFTDSMAEMLGAMGFAVHMPTLNIVLPVGISFYTFQSLSYTIDVYRRRIEPTQCPIDFALFVAYFPQLVAGPIERAGHLLPALASQRRVQWQDLAIGVELILIGFLKKVGVADAVAPLVDARFLAPNAFSGQDLLFVSYLFAIQVYCDFSGYSDIARGTSRLFGIRLMRNFDQPYFSRSITEFWRRWHISLSTWLRDYLYITFGGNRFGQWRTYRNLMLTMLLGGLWHGANWTFVIWGGLHGLFLSAHKWLLQRRGMKDPVPPGNPVADAFKIVFTFHLVVLTFIFFRAASLDDAIGIIQGILSWQSSQADSLSWTSPRIMLLLAILFTIDLVQLRTGQHAPLVGGPNWLRGPAYAMLIIFTVSLGNLVDHVPFIYFQF